jgi:hypothetical protein
MRRRVLCDHCPALAVVFRLDWADQPALCFCMACAVRDGWPWGVVTETPARRKSR